MLKGVRKTILDVKATSWHDDYNKFRSGIKDLEVMVQNVINSAFTTVTTVQEGVELLEVFFHLTAREVKKGGMGGRNGSEEREGGMEGRNGGKGVEGYGRNVSLLFFFFEFAEYQACC